MPGAHLPTGDWVLVSSFELRLTLAVTSTWQLRACSSKELLLERQNSACPDIPEDRGLGKRVQVKMDKPKECNTFRRIGKHLKHQDMFVRSHLVPGSEIFAIIAKQQTPSRFHLRGFRRTSCVQTQTKRQLKAVMRIQPGGERQRE